MLLAEKEEIHKILPHRPPVVMIDNLKHTDGKHIVSVLEIREDNIFTFNGFFTEPGLVENIAQTAAAGYGYDLMVKGIEVPLGYIAAVKDLKIHFLPRSGATITTEVDIVNVVLGFQLLLGKVHVDGKLAAECEMKIFVKKD